MKNTIDAFKTSRDIAVAGVSPRKGNWGLMLMQELKKSGYTVYPVNPKFAEIEDAKCYESLADLPPEVENLILAVNPKRSVEMIGQLPVSGIKRVWMNQGIGEGAFSEEGLELLKKKNLEYVYGFCPMMFFGKGLHKFHYWIRRNLGKTPAEFSLN